MKIDTDIFDRLNDNAHMQQRYPFLPPIRFPPCSILIQGKE